MRKLGAIWGVTGILILLATGIMRLIPVVFDAYAYHLTWYQWISTIFFTFFVTYLKGYRVFQLKLAPRFVNRAMNIYEHPTLMRCVLAPFYCLGYFQAPRKKQFTSLGMTVGMVIVVMLVRLLPQPWRGILDFSVVVALVWGILALPVISIRNLISLIRKPVNTIVTSVGSLD